MRAREPRYEQLVEALAGYVFTVYLRDGQPARTTHGSNCVTVTGYTAEDFDTKPYLWIEMVPREDHPLVEDHLRRLLRGERAGDLEHRIRRKDGQLRWVSVVCVPEYDETGCLVSYDGVIRDITPRKQAQEELRVSEQRYRALMANIPGIIVRRACAPPHAVCFLSEGMVSLTGYRAEDLLEGRIRGYDDIIVTEDCESVRLALAQAASGPYVVDYRVVPLSGGVRWVRERGQVTDRQGDTSQWLDGVIVDITEHKRAEALVREQATALQTANAELKARERQLRRQRGMLARACEAAESASRAKSTFLANMSHEIRTPMTAILGFADNLTDPDLSESERADAVEIIRRNGAHLLRIINDILDLSKIEAGKETVEPGPCPLCAVVTEVISLMRIRAESKGLALNVEYIGGVPETIHTDRHCLRRILINLLSNAIKFTEVGGVRVFVRCIRDRANPFVYFDVVDTGIGMSEEQLARLFQPFTQAAVGARAEGRPFEVILMDIQMPVMDGYTATRALRKAGYTGPIIALTAHATAIDRQKCIDAGCDDYASKPVNRVQLIETIRSHVPRRGDAAKAAETPADVLSGKSVGSELLPRQEGLTLSTR